MLSRGIIEIVLLSAAAGYIDLPVRNLPEIDLNKPNNFDATTCEKFEQNAYFEPKEVVDSLWKIFYFWANGVEVSTILFSLPSDKKISNFRTLVETYNPELNIEWEKAALFMEPRPDVKVLLFSRPLPGSYLAVVKGEKHENERDVPHVHATDVRLKTVGRYMGIMNCDDGTAFALARLHDMPDTYQHCKAAAQLLGFNVNTGKSYITPVPDLHVLDEL
ncbi:PREDICTED: uncharacterized protein LOC106099548 [Papilio polytes]|uniref:uncharacterized protein LOC106099548 n=1 Tax=Papilio polytes TaxID=76194 RepID=UPI00067696F5|nr:PREDICTED: uncharacterized protein LOC106099548 [Papilio polytes]